MNISGMDLALKEITGSKNVLIEDDLGTPSIMVKIPRFNLSDVISGAPNTPHPMFIVDGVVKDSIYIGKYLSTVWDQRAYSLPSRDPSVNMTLDDAKQYSYNKGAGWHVMSNAERAGIALWCKANGYFPYGNTNGGKNYSKPFYRGTSSIKTNAGTYSVGDVAKTANLGTDNFIEFNKSNATALTLDAFEGATINGTSFVGGKTNCTISSAVADKIEKMEFYINKRADSVTDSMSLLSGVNNITSYNVLNSEVPCVIKDGSLYKMWFIGTDASSKKRVLYSESLDLVKWDTPMLVMDLTASNNCSAQLWRPCVIKDGSTFRMWVGGTDASGNVRILYSTSSDGVHWNVPTIAINNDTATGSKTVQACAPWVIQESDGSFTMWFMGVSSTKICRTFRCTSTDAKTWSTPSVVIDCTITSDGSTYFGSHELSVIKDDSTYKMWYLLVDATGNNTMYRESADGITWGTASTSLAMSSPISQNVVADGYTTPSIFNDSGVYHLFFTGHNSSDSKNRIYKAALADKKTVPLSVMNLNIGTNTNNANGNYTPFVMKDGITYKMWFAGKNSSGITQILYTESADGATWASPIIALAVGGTYSSGSLTYPYVIKESDTSYKMWVDGNDGTTERICYSTSTDGKTWTTPVLAINVGTNASGYNSKVCSVPCVIKDGSTYKMWLMGSNGTARVLYSTSTDGLTWTAPVLAMDVTASSDGYCIHAVVASCVIKDTDGTYRMWLVGNDGTVGRMLYATSTDGLKWTEPIIARDYIATTYEMSIGTGNVIHDTTAGLWKMWYYTNDSGSTGRVRYITSSIPSQFGPVPSVNVQVTAGASANTLSPFMIYDSADSKYKLYFTGNSVTSLTSLKIFYSESYDLTTWTTPILILNIGTTIYNTLNTANPCVYKKSDGTFIMWLDACDNTNWRIMYSTSTDGKHWTTPVLAIDHGTATYVSNPSVVKNSDGTFTMWYKATTSNVSSIYMVTSADGITWGTSVLCNGIMSVGTLSNFNVVYNKDRYHAFITTSTATTGTVYHQTSVDGVNWSRDAASKQIFLQAAFNTNATLWNYANVLQVNDRLLILASGGDASSAYRIQYGYTPFLTQALRLRSTTSDGTVRTRRIDNSMMLVSKGASPILSYIQRPFILKESDTSYKMWSSMSDGTNWRLGYSTSTDGKKWSTPVLVMDIGNSTYNTMHCFAPTVIKEASNSYKMWFSGFNGTNWRILYSTSTDGISWAAPVLAMDIGGTTYNTVHSSGPTVVKESDTSYKMWFNGNDGTNNRILYTTSTDGKTWTTPILVLDIGVCSAANSNRRPCVIKESDTSYKMWFDSYGTSGGVTATRTLYTTSSDGKNWSTPVIAIDVSTCVYNDSESGHPFVIKDTTNSKYMMWYIGTDLNSDTFLLYCESADGVTNWVHDVTDPIVLSNMNYTPAQNSADGYINANIVSIQPAYYAQQVFKYQAGTSIQRLQMRNTKKVHFEIRSAASKDGKTPSNLLMGNFYTNGDIQDIYLKIDSRTSDSTVTLYSKSGTAMLATVSPTGYSIAGDDGTPNDDGIVVTDSVFTSTGDIIDSQAKIIISEVYGDIDIVRTLTGTCGTGHDGTPDGIMDLTGNVWEMLAGLKIESGQIQVTPNNDSALQFYCDDDYLQAVDQSGNLIDPSNTGSLFFDGAAGSTVVNTKVTTNVGDSGASSSFVSLNSAAGVTVPMLLKTLGLFPIDSNDHGDSVFKYKTVGTGMPIFGGDANSLLVNGGPFTLSFLMGEGLISPSVGFRLCYYEP